MHQAHKAAHVGAEAVGGGQRGVGLAKAHRVLQAGAGSWAGLGVVGELVGWIGRGAGSLGGKSCRTAGALLAIEHTFTHNQQDNTASQDNATLLLNKQGAPLRCPSRRR